MQAMDAESGKCFDESVKKNDLSLVLRGNDLKRWYGESKKHLLILEQVQSSNFNCSRKESLYFFCFIIPDISFYICLNFCLDFLVLFNSVFALFLGYRYQYYQPGS